MSIKQRSLLPGFATLTAIALSLLAGQAGQIKILGGLSSIQSVNTDSCPASGFEILLPGFHPDAVREVGVQSRFGTVSVLNAGTVNAPATLVRYGSEAEPGLLAAGAYTLFGVSLPSHPAPGRRTLRWLHDPNVCGPGRPLSLPGHSVSLVANTNSPSGLVLREVLTQDASENGGQAVWVLPYRNQIRGRTTLDALADTNDIVRNALPAGGGTNRLVPLFVGPGASIAFDSFVSSPADNTAIFKYRVFADTTDAQNNHVPGAELACFTQATVTGDSTAPYSPRKLLLVVEEKIYPLLTPSLAQYMADVGLEGWSVSVVTAPSSVATNKFQAMQVARDIVWPWVKDGGISHVFLVGNVPMPRSGLNHNPDGHIEFRGAYSSPGYYGCPSTAWSDLYTGEFSNASFSNTLGDGRCDQNTFPQPPAASVGVLNFKSDKAPPNWETVRVQRMVQYFNRLHEYRTGKWAVRERALYPYPVTGSWLTYSLQHWTVVNQFKSMFGSNAVFNATAEIMATTNVAPAVKMMWIKSDQYGSAVGKATVPKVVMYMPLNSGQFSYSTYLHGNDLYNAMSATNGPLITAVNHFNYPWRLDRLKAGGCVGDAYLDTTSLNGYAKETWIAFMGDPALRLW